MKTNAPIETEYKLAVPEAEIGAVLADLEALSGGSIQVLHASYFDTRRDALAARGISLRLRHEGDRWVQTLKRAQDMGGPRREEHEVDLDASVSSPDVDLGRHADSKAGKRTMKVLCRAGKRKAPAKLVKRYATHVTRHKVPISIGRSRIELAFDQGHLSAGSLRAPVAELEIELKEGEPADVIQTVRRWQERHALWLEPASKAERARWLAKGEGRPVQKALPPTLGDPLSLEGLGRAMVGNTLAQILPNASAVAGGSVQADHIHQLRVGLRRLRAVLKMLGPTIPGLPVRAEPALTEVFRELGRWRDRQTVLAGLAPELVKDGAPDVGWIDTIGQPAIDLGAVVRGTTFQQSLIELSAYAHLGGDEPCVSRKSLRRSVSPILQKLRRQVTRAGKRFDELPETEQHQTRKRLKRLRYLAELAGPVYKPKAVKPFLSALEPAQDALGRHNDLVVAAQAADDVAPDAGVDFAREWLDAEKQKSSRRSARSLACIATVKPFWR